VVERLRAHALPDGWTDELAARAEAAYTARTVADLTVVLHDLPERGLAATSRQRRRGLSAWHVPAYGTVCAGGTTVVVALADGGFRGAFDGVAAVAFWATLACGNLLAARIVGARLGAQLLPGTRRPT
jgi:hypothetical protein